VKALAGPKTSVIDAGLHRIAHASLRGRRRA
jgi:hypothetical protein